MKTIQLKHTTLLALLALLSILNCQLSTLLAQGTAFTYQGRLNDGASPANGSYDMQFALRDALTPPGNPVGTTNTIAPVAVSNGLFTVMLDFGAGIFTGPPRWLEIGVRTNGSVAAYTTLSPRQALTATPYAIQAGNAGTLGGQSASAYVAKAGDTMTGALNLPADGLAVGGSQLVASGGNLGLGVANPAAHLQINQAGAGVGLFLGNRTPFGQALLETDVTAPASHAWFAENGVRVFSVTGGGRVDVAGPAYFAGNAGISGTLSANQIFASFVTVNAGNSVFAAVQGENTGSGAGVYGLNDSTGDGVYGSSSGNGVHGVSSSASQSGVWGQNTGTGYAVHGTSTGGAVGVGGDSVTSVGVWGSSSSGYGVKGFSVSSDGVNGTTVSGGNAAGVWGQNNTAGGTAVVGAAYGLNGTGLYATGPGHAGYFDGNVYISGTLSLAGTKSFKIDHPLDPSEKYLFHSCVESPDVMNIYNGNITTDAAGDATVALPGYFEALNRDFRYQLTVLGQFAQAIVSSEIKGNQFSIKTDKPNVKVSWQVTGIRQDAYMKAHPMVVEQDKPANERGSYQHPELFGQPEEKGLAWARYPGMMKRAKEERAKQAASSKP